MRDMVLVLGFDETAARAIARKLRGERIYCKIVPGSITAAQVKEEAPLGLILAGSAAGSERLPGFDPELLLLGTPVLALGDAALGLSAQLGGKAETEPLPRQVAPVHYEALPLFEEMSDSERLLDGVKAMTLADTLQPAFMALDSVLGFSHQTLPFFGLQILMEPNDPDGVQILVNFAKTLCGCTPWWDNDSFVERAVGEIRRVVGDEGRAICAMSGGVDSGVCALLGHMAIGSRLQCIFVDTGLLRKEEGEQVAAFYQDTMGLNLRRIDAQDKFLSALKGVAKDSEKQRIIDALLADTLQEALKECQGAQVLLRGLNYNDLISASPEADPLVSLFDEGQIQVVDPVRDLFKDEIRRVGDDLGLPPSIIGRQPFPGGGLALRIMGEVTVEKLEILREADAIFRQEVEESGQGRKLWQHFAMLCPNPIDGSLIVCLRAVHASDGSKAMPGRLPYDLLERTTARIQETLPVSRVLYDLTPSTHYTGIQWQ